MLPKSNICKIMKLFWLLHRRQAANMLQHQSMIIIYMGLWPEVLFAGCTPLKRYMYEYVRKRMFGWQTVPNFKFIAAAKVSLPICRELRGGKSPDKAIKSA